ncbi:hypothetical protein Acin_0793 [Acidaminococcus intestini RyC-MR95]|uniref:Uncharacterized protein n=1 Tax=Acidaminococcus intestini (strain RyC-MR95) TaxID=568816 RepID=G4Q543_ACIIR|nr:hypothetical protein Acin_0793 [Acidaminococcus intestini RyC-MR95]
MELCIWQQGSFTPYRLPHKRLHYTKDKELCKKRFSALAKT